MGSEEDGSPDRLVFMEIRELAATCRPCRLRRRHGMTLVVVDPRGTCREITDWMVTRLNEAEQTVMRQAFGQPPPGEYCEDWMVSDRLCFLYVPPTLRLTGAPALQGGSELRRRWRRGDLDLEQKAYLAELQSVSAAGA